MAEQNGEIKKPKLAGGSGLNSTTSTPGTSLNISARLPSFRGPRDLTLSTSSSSPAVKPSLISRTRKTFTPNIPLRREKNEKILESRSDKISKNRDRVKKEGCRGRGRGREYVQTAGAIFGQGVAAITQRRGVMGGAGGGGGGGGGSGKAGDAGFMLKPVLNLDAMNNIDKDHEDQKLKEILRDDFIDDLDDVIGRDSNGDLFPVQLPMVDTGRVFKEEDESDSKDIKSFKPSGSDVRVKNEPDDPEDKTDTSDMMQDILKETNHIKLEDKKVPVSGSLPAKEPVKEPSVAQLLSGKHKDIIFFQLPNSLPSHPPEVKQEPNTKTMNQQHQQQQQQQKSQVSNNTGSDEEEDQRKQIPKYCTLNTLPEGQIGTLKIYKSGKTEIWFGQHKLSVNQGTQVGFLEDVVSVETNEEAKTGVMTVLGHIGHRVVCSPDLETLVRQRKT